MDHSSSPRITALCDELVGELARVDSGIALQHLLQDLFTRLDLKVVAVVLPDELDAEHMPNVYRAMQSCVSALQSGVSTLAIVGQPDTGHRFVGVHSPDAEPANPKDSDDLNAGRFQFREDITIQPDGASFAVSHMGPFDLHLPTWVDHHTACEISGILWRVLRFALVGIPALGRDGEFLSIAREALAGSGRERYAAQYAALGYMRWLLGIAGIRTYDYYGNEVEDGPDKRYSDLFAKPEHMPAEYAQRAAHVEAQKPGLAAAG